MSLSAQLKHGHAFQGRSRSSREQSRKINKAFNSTSDPPGGSPFVNSLYDICVSH